MTVMEDNGSIVEHIPVLTEPLLEQIKLPQDGVMVDATIGHGGHSYLFGKQLGPAGTIVGFDVDENSLEKARETLKTLSCNVILLRSNFAHVEHQLKERGIKKVNFILADLGICSAQLADPDLGLSFQTNMPLDMRIDKRIKTTAADIVNRADERTLADLIFKFGQDRASRRIARFIVQQRKTQPIETTGRLAEIVARALKRPGKRQKPRIHPATRTFQALRIAVNNELESVEKLLGAASSLLKTGGYVAIISFHSLEDRLVKLDFRQKKQDCVYRVLTKKPIVPTPNEIERNRRARSAKLRIAQKASKGKKAGKELQNDF